MTAVSDSLCAQLKKKIETKYFNSEKLMGKGFPFFISLEHNDRGHLHSTLFFTHEFIHKFEEISINGIT